MRKHKLLLLCCLVALVGNSQENNPYNKQGLQLLNTLRIVSDDVSKGLFSDYSEMAIKNYAAKLPVKTEMSVDLLSAITKTIKSPGFTLVQFLKNSSMPELLKKIFKEILYYSVESALPATIKRFSELTDEVLRSELGELHKELALTIVAMVYNGNGFLQSLKGRPKEPSCYVFGPEGSGVAYGSACVFLGAITGAWLGFEMCGVFCMVGGAIVGGIVGALS